MAGSGELLEDDDAELASLFTQQHSLMGDFRAALQRVDHVALRQRLSLVRTETLDSLLSDGAAAMDNAA